MNRREAMQTTAALTMTPQALLSANEKPPNSPKIGGTKKSLQTTKTKRTIHVFKATPLDSDEYLATPKDMKITSNFLEKAIKDLQIPILGRQLNPEKCTDIRLMQSLISKCLPCHLHIIYEPFTYHMAPTMHINMQWSDQKKWPGGFNLAEMCKKALVDESTSIMLLHHDVRTFFEQIPGEYVKFTFAPTSLMWESCGPGQNLWATVHYDYKWTRDKSGKLVQLESGT